MLPWVGKLVFPNTCFLLGLASWCCPKCVFLGWQVRVPQHKLPGIGRLVCLSTCSLWLARWCSPTCVLSTSSLGLASWCASAHAPWGWQGGVPQHVFIGVGKLVCFKTCSMGLASWCSLGMFLPGVAKFVCFKKKVSEWKSRASSILLTHDLIFPIIVLISYLIASESV